MDDKGDDDMLVLGCRDAKVDTPPRNTSSLSHSHGHEEEISIDVRKYQFM